MAIERAKTLAAFAFLGFVIGSIGYFLYELTFAHLDVSVSPILGIFGAPWFFAGLAGAILSDVVVVTWAYVTREK